MPIKITAPILVSVFAIALTLGVFMVTRAAADLQQITVCVNNAGSMRLNPTLTPARYTTGIIIDKIIAYEILT